MAWELLPVDYTDAVWSGLKRYTQVDNSDGTVSFQDVTQYSNKEKSFFGAKDANRIDEAVNALMSMVENGTDLYEAFQNYFATQKGLFEAAADEKKEEFDEYTDNLKTAYSTELTTFENQQEQVFQVWFQMMKDQLSKDAAGNLQNEITNHEERLANVEYMILHNDFFCAIDADDNGAILVDEDNCVIVADWKYEVQ